MQGQPARAAGLAHSMLLAALSPRKMPPAGRQGLGDYICVLVFFRR